MRVMGSAVLAFEVIVVLLAIPVALSSDPRTALVVWSALALVAVLIVALGVLRTPYGITVGWIAQLGIIAYGFIEPWMFVVGGIFVILWWAAIHYGSKVEAAGRLRSSEAENDGESKE